MVKSRPLFLKRFDPEKKATEVRSMVEIGKCIGEAIELWWFASPLECNRDALPVGVLLVEGKNMGFERCVMLVRCL